MAVGTKDWWEVLKNLQFTIFMMNLETSKSNRRFASHPKIFIAGHLRIIVICNTTANPPASDPRFPEPFLVLGAGTAGWRPA